MPVLLGEIQRKETNDEIINQLVEIAGIENIREEGSTHKYYVANGIKVVYEGLIHGTYKFKVYQEEKHEVIIDFSFGREMFYNRKKDIEMGIHYQEIRTEDDFRKWIGWCGDLQKLHVEIDRQSFFHIFKDGYCTNHLNLLRFSKAKLLTICEELGIRQLDF